MLFDVAIIGGGINGCGIARDAAGRGARVILFERGDLASGTSSASSKLIHGGLRYLEHYEFGLVREALGERELLWRMAPHIIWPMRFVLPHVAGLRPRWLVRLGLFLYDHIGGRKRLPATETIDLRDHPAGGPLLSRYREAFVYSDGWVDDARLVVLNARDAADRGATVLPQTAVEHFARDGTGWRISAGGRTYRAKALINAAGPDAVAVLEDAKLGDGHRMRRVRGSHIVTRRLYDHPFPYFFQLPDERIFFVIPYEQDFTLIGTTDCDQEPDQPIVASAEEIAYLCEGVNRFLQAKIAPSDVVWSYAGVRPLIDDGSGKPEEATRGYVLDLSPEEEGAPLLNVFGGKLTVYRHLADEAVTLLAHRLPHLSGQPWTDGSHLPGGDFPMDGAANLQAELHARYRFLAEKTVDRIVKAYGTLGFRIFGDADSLQDCGMDFGAGLTAKEVDYLMDREWARCADDVLWRRTKLGLRLDKTQRATLDGYMQQRISECPSGS